MERGREKAGREDDEGGEEDGGGYSKRCGGWRRGGHGEEVGGRVEWGPRMKVLTKADARKGLLRSRKEP